MLALTVPKKARENAVLLTKSCHEVSFWASLNLRAQESAHEYGLANERSESKSIW